MSEKDSQPSELRPISYRPELPDWGVYLRWPADGVDWLHPDDVQRARSLLPSARVFRRETWDGEYYHLHYGRHRLRVQPSMWLPVAPVDLRVEQQVELLARLGRHDSGVFRIAEILYDAANRTVTFQLSRGEVTLERLFSRDDLRPISVKHHLRVGYYQHETPKQDAKFASDKLDVGKITDDQ
ncbi:MAG TPA: hypothetical protein DDW52_00995 [Planctomycetaceae bacterium]|nr:hypothetical protein [Planctomycetaceae bacterium]